MKHAMQSVRVTLYTLLSLIAVNAHADLHVLVVAGLGGEAKYQTQFDNEAKAIQTASNTVTNASNVHLLIGATATRNNIATQMQQLAGSLTKEDRLAVYLIGHGSDDGYQYKFNLPGPDLSGTELARWLNAIKAENQLVVATGSSSGALLEPLKKDSRIVITATRSGNERNATHFGELFAEALSDASVDTDKNGRATAQEVFALTNRKVSDYFVAESRLATEHAQLVGTRADAFTLVQLANAALPSATTANAELLAQREALNSQLEELRLRKDSLGEDEYLKQLEPLLLKVAELDAKLNGDAP